MILQLNLFFWEIFSKKWFFSGKIFPLENQSVSTLTVLMNHSMVSLPLRKMEKIFHFFSHKNLIKFCLEDFSQKLWFKLLFVEKLFFTLLMMFLSLSSLKVVVRKKFLIVFKNYSRTRKKLLSWNTHKDIHSFISSIKWNCFSGLDVGEVNVGGVKYQNVDIYFVFSVWKK